MDLDQLALNMLWVNDHSRTRRVRRDTGDHPGAFVLLDGEHRQGEDLVEGSKRCLQSDAHDVLTHELENNVDDAVFWSEALFEKIIFLTQIKFETEPPTEKIRSPGPQSAPRKYSLCKNS